MIRASHEMNKNTKIILFIYYIEHFKFRVIKNLIIQKVYKILMSNLLIIKYSPPPSQ